MSRRVRQRNMVSRGGDLLVAAVALPAALGLRDIKLDTDIVEWVDQRNRRY